MHKFGSPDGFCLSARALYGIVVEAGFKSGALNTASQAMLLGRLVGCIPGPIDSPRSAGSNQFIRDGAQILPSVADALALLELSQNKAAGTSQLGWLEAELWDKLGEGDWTVDGLAAAIGAPVRDVLDSATRLELKGLVSTRPGGGICRVVLESARA